MKRIIILLPFLVLLVRAEKTSENQKEKAPTSLPNIIFILADDMGYGSVQANNPKSPVSTPNLDKLVAQGMNFTDAHTDTSVCTPTRYGLLTGRYSWRSSLKSGVTWPWYPSLLKKEILTVPELLKEGGYSTALIGKWHLGLDFFYPDGKTIKEARNLPDNINVSCGRGKRTHVGVKWRDLDFSKGFAGGPLDHGFDYFFGENLPNFAPYCFFENRKLVGDVSSFVNKPKEMFGTPGPALPDWSLEAVLPTLTKRAVKYVKEQAKSEKPFFLYMPLPSPHTPIVPAEEFKGKSGIEDNKYADFLWETDWSVGQVMKALEESGQAKDTLIIFTTDNGTAFTDKSSHILKAGINHQHRGSKRSIYEGGHRVPYIVRWPDVTPAGSSCDNTIGLNDLLATCAALTDRSLSESEGVDSNNVLPLFKGEKREKDPAIIHHDFQGSYALRDGDWKLVYSLHPKEDVFTTELYNLSKDVKETENIASQFPEKVEELAALFKKLVKDGRSTKGEKQANFEDPEWVLPF